MWAVGRFSGQQTNAVDVLFNESIDGDTRYSDVDICIYDSISGKCYPTLFDLQQELWASHEYNRDSNPPSPTPYIPYEFSELQPAFEWYKVPLIGIHYHLAPIKLGDNFQAPIINMLEFG